VSNFIGEREITGQPIPLQIMNNNNNNIVICTVHT